MRGLLLKDIFQFAKNCKMLLLSDLILIVVSFVSKDNIAFSMIPILTSAILPITMLSFDERSGWMEYSGTLPFSEGQIVSEKYLFGLMVQSATAVLVFAALIVQGKIYDGVDLVGIAMEVAGIFAVSLAVPSLCMPFCLKLGVEKGRYVYYPLIGAGSVCVMVFSDPEAWEQSPIKGMEWIILAAIAGIYIISWIVSVKVLKSVKR